MLLSGLTKHIKIFANTSSKTAEVPICTEKEFHAILARERFRNTRSNCVFSIAYFRLKKRSDTKSTNSFIKHLKKKIRSTDELGWFDSKSIGVFLYNTPKEGASYFVEKVKADTTMQKKLHECRVYTYPSEWLNFEDDNNTPINLSKGGSSESENRQETQPKNKALFQETFQPPCILPIWKRGLDLFVAFVGLILLSPFFLLLTIFIKIVSPGPVFFKQERIGYGGKPFTFWKFRTMEIKADVSSHQKQMAELIKGKDSNKPMIKQDNNPHIIPFGKILRKTCVDEFPQFINVIRGEMSLIGPRPPIPYEVRDYRHWHKERFNVLPGLTGLWQVSGKNRLTFNEMIRLDIKYVRRISLLLDLKILLLTPRAILTQVKDSISDRFSIRLPAKANVQLDRRSKPRRQFL
jgi:lipopolysaccharide/colanic/teichoic acid biosynthesis glycosyltransferase